MSANPNEGDQAGTSDPQSWMTNTLDNKGQPTTNNSSPIINNWTIGMEVEPEFIAENDEKNTKQEQSKL